MYINKSITLISSLTSSLIGLKYDLYNHICMYAKFLKNVRKCYLRRNGKTLIKRLYIQSVPFKS